MDIRSRINALVNLIADVEAKRNRVIELLLSEPSETQDCCLELDSLHELTISFGRSLSVLLSEAQA